MTIVHDILRARNFNSHAHVERDTFHFVFVLNFQISTHTLTWSVTRDACMVCNANPNFNSHAHVERDYFTDIDFKDFEISTHTLTWSVTLINVHRNKIVQFQLTRSRGA